MKRAYISILTILILSYVTIANAQDKYSMRPNYVNFNYALQDISLNGSDQIRSDVAAALSVGHTFYLFNSKPLGGMVRFGIDATWIDVNYAYYDLRGTSSTSFSDEIHQLELGVQVGPSITVTPIKNLNISAYFRYAPTFASRVAFDEDLDENYVGGNYASFFVTGASISYGIIGLGVERRWGNPLYKNLDVDIEGLRTPLPTKLETDAFRFYLSIRL
ncbi:MAG: hypothetical protein ACRC6R_02295 [Bacteroidales bacterium]